jgi:hypothetical protein
MRINTRFLGVAPLVVVLVLGGCKDLQVPDFNNPGIDDIANNPNRANINAQAQGLLIGARNGMANRAGYVSEVGILGRESYNFDAADPRFITELLRDPLVGGNGAFGGNHWAARYANIRNANGLLTAVDAAEENGTIFTPQQIAGLRGFARTMQALDLLLVINTRDTYGAPIDVGGDPTGEPAPIESKAAVFDQIVAWLDDGAGDLGAAGSTFSFNFSPGFAGFDTPSTFLEFNRAIRSRVDVYMGNYQDALDHLAESFIVDDPVPSVDVLNVGVYHTYSEGTGDVTNVLYDPAQNVILAHPSIVSDAQAGDARLARKTVQLSEPVSNQTPLDISTDVAFTIYNSLSDGVPIIRNEELILLRAEAYLGLGMLNEARLDINRIRQGSGNLAAIDQPTWDGFTDAQRLDELLYNRRYSLLFEGHRWIDLRRYDRLDTLPLDDPTLVVHDKFPFPQTECDPRSTKPAGCTAG